MSELAWARFADTMAEALQQLATELRAEATTTGEPTARGRVAETQAVYAAVGERQGQVLLALLQAPEWGMTTREVADAIGYDTANAWNVLRRLQTMGLVELVP